MNVVLFFPPQWHPGFPHLATPLLAGSLLCRNYEVESCDLNVDFYNEHLTKDVLFSCINKASNYIKETENKYNELKIKDKLKLSLEEKISIKKFETIKEYLDNGEKRTSKIINYIDEAVNVMKSDKFYDPQIHYKAKIIIEHALDIVSLPYFPTKINTGRYYNPFFNLSYKDIIYQCNNKDINIFYEYFENKLKNKYTDCNIFGISIASESQIVAALTLAKILKKRANAKVILGGSLITRIYETFLDHAELFNEYCDYVLPDDGEERIVDLVDAIYHKKDFTSVSGLIYINEDNKVIKNKKTKELIVENIKQPILKGLTLEKYFTPDMIMLIQLSKGCYWGKCAFCSFSYKKDFSHRKIENIIEEIKYYKDNFNIKYFRFTDDAIPPKFFNELADAFIKEKLDIKYAVFCRFEEEFTLDLLRKMKQSGCELIQWGLETSSKRLLKLLKKGTENTDKELILKNSNSVGISNFLFLMYGLPTETYNEALETVNFVKENWNNIMGYTLARFCLEKKSILIDNYKDYGIEEVYNNEEFLAHCTLTGDQMSYDELEKIKKTYQNCFAITQDNKYRLSSILLTDYILLYILKYGKNHIKNYTI